MNNYFSPNQANRLSQLEQQQMGNVFPNYQIPQQQIKKANVIYSLVDGFEGASSFSLMIGEVGLLFDREKSEFYKKTIDEMGITTLKRYEYKEVAIPTSKTAGIASNDAALNKRIENIENALNCLLAQSRPQNQPQKTEEIKK